MSRARSIAAITAVSALGLGGLAVGAAGPAAGGGGPVPSLVLEKQVVGTAPADAEFVIDVFCTIQTPGITAPVDAQLPQAIAVIVLDEFVFGPEGGVEEIPLERVGGDTTVTCEVEEVETGGAVDVTPPQVIEITENIPYDAVVENVFDTPDTSTPEETTTTGAAAAAGAARATPRFTG
jgi:hypothetical protein